MDRLQVVRVVNRFNQHSESLDGHRFVDTWRSTLFGFRSVWKAELFGIGWMCQLLLSPENDRPCVGIEFG